MNKVDLTQTDCDDLSCHIGASFILNLVCWQTCGVDEPVNLDGYTATIKVVDDDGNSVVDIDGTIADPTTGEIDFILSPTETDDLTAGLYDYKLDLQTGSNIYRISYGKFEVIA